MDLLDLVGATDLARTSERDGGRFVAFASWTAEDLVGLRGLGRLQLVEAGVEAVSADASDRDLFVVASGELEVWSSAPGASRLIGRLGPGEVFGEMAFVDGRPRSASVKAISASRLVRISPEELDELASREPRLAMQFLTEIARIICDRLRHTQTG